MHIESTTYTDSKKIIEYVYKKYGISYSSTGIISFLHRNDFSYKAPCKTPAKGKVEDQYKFKEKYFKLKAKLKDEVILFSDAVHPTMATKVSYGWIRTGVNKEINTTASKTRVNLLGAIELDTMNIVSSSYDKINSDTMCIFLDKIKESYPKKKVNIILDNGPYNKSKQTTEYAKLLGINLIFLPSYSPNLNPIERLWKLMNEKVRNNVFFTSAVHFRTEILNFFSNTWNNIKNDMKNRINDNFHIKTLDILK